MIHGRHNGVSLNFQAKIPIARIPNTIPMILVVITQMPFYEELIYWLSLELAMRLRLTPNSAA